MAALDLRGLLRWAALWALSLLLMACNTPGGGGVMVQACVKAPQVRQANGVDRYHCEGESP